MYTHENRMKTTPTYIQHRKYIGAIGNLAFIMTAYIAPKFPPRVAPILIASNISKYIKYMYISEKCIYFILSGNR